MNKRPRQSKPLAERFWPKVALGEPWDCWLWTATFNNQGYGALTRREGGGTLAHRIAWELTVGPIPAGEVLRHLCHDPLCCNPCHLMPGSQSQNLLDRRTNPYPKPIPARPPKRPPVPTVLRGCLTCRAMFAVPLSQVERGAGLFCQRACVRHSMEERFWKRVRKTDTCWLWTGAKSNGYGALGKGPKGTGNVPAHRFSWELLRGLVPNDKEVCHNCPGGDQRACVNPDHLFLGTHQQNVDDMVAKDRHWMRKLSATRVREMRRRHAAGESVDALAEAFSVSWAAAWEAIVHRTWKAVK